MPGGVSILKLGSVFLNYCAFSWPRYRGLLPRSVEIVQPGVRLEEIEAEVRGLNGGPTSLTVGGPDGPGARPGDDVVEIGGVYVHRVAADGALCRVTLYDARWRLLRFVNDRDFNLAFGDGFLSGTEKSGYRDAVGHIINSSAPLGALFSDDALDRIPARTLPANLQLSGLPMLTALGWLCEEGGFDLTARVDGKLTFANRLDAPNQYLPDRDAYDWLHRPGWTFDKQLVLGRPQKFHVYSSERHCLRLTNADETTNAAKELLFSLEQVYISKGNVYTLAELLAANEFAETDLSEAQIADSILTDTLQGSVVSQFSHTEQGRAVIQAVKECWRLCWRIAGANSEAKWGAWTGMEFGKIASDGSAVAVAVDCPWVEIFTVFEAEEGSSSSLNAALSENHDGPSPFRATWAIDEAAGVIRLELDNSRLKDRQNLAIPGALQQQLRVRGVPAVSDGEGNSVTLKNYQLVDSEDPSKARFGHSFELDVYLCATKRMPNDERRWHMEVAEGYSDGDLPWVELGAGGIPCVRDYVDLTDPDHQAQSDGLGPVLNAEALAADAERRAQQWCALYGMTEYEPAVAERLRMFRELDLNGPIREIALDLTLEGEAGDVQVMRSRLEVGALSDPAALADRKAQRLTARRYDARGISVA